MFCQKCGSEILDEAVICVHCGCMVKKAPPQNAPMEDKVNPFWMTLSILVPLAGIIYGTMNHNQIPNTGKAYILTGILSSVAYFFILGYYYYWF